MDSLTAHINIAIAEFCSERDIILYCFIPHASHIQQPLDLSFFGSLKTYWNKAVKEFCANSSRVVEKKNFIEVFFKAWQTACTPANLISGFRKVGIVPFNVDAVDIGRLSSNSVVYNQIDTIDTPLKNGELIGIKRILMTVENILPDNMKGVFESLISKTDFATDGSWGYLWLIYKDIKTKIIELSESLKPSLNENELIIVRELATDENVEQFSVEENLNITLNDDATVLPRPYLDKLDLRQEIDEEAVEFANKLNNMDDDAILAEFEEIVLQERLEEERINKDRNKEDTMNQEQVQNDSTTQEQAVDEVNRNIECANEVSPQSIEPSTSNSKPYVNWDRSPFKKHLKIAETIPIKKKTTKTKRKLPSAVTGKEYIEFMQNINLKKIEDEKKKRRLRRNGKK